MKKWFFLVVLVFGSVSAIFFFLLKNQAQENNESVSSLLVQEKTSQGEEEQTRGKEIKINIPEKELNPLPKSFLIPLVPFTVQAPFAEWSDPIFQDACEEASILMAQAWVEGTLLTKEQAKKGIEALAKYQKKIFGHSVDTSVEDTRSLLRDVLGVKNSEVQRGVTIIDIQEALVSERLAIVPTDGRKLKNPNFKQPGPSRHMLVIVGYDTETKEFIVNDPGTRKGEGYRYAEAVLYDAMLDYPTGKHAETKSTDKVMLTVWH